LVHVIYSGVSGQCSHTILGSTPMRTHIHVELSLQMADGCTETYYLQSEGIQSHDGQRHGTE